jgi:hypothetical protein
VISSKTKLLFSSYRHRSSKVRDSSLALIAGETHATKLILVIEDLNFERERLCKFFTIRLMNGSLIPKLTHGKAGAEMKVVATLTPRISNTSDFASTSLMRFMKPFLV